MLPTISTCVKTNTDLLDRHVPRTLAHSRNELTFRAVSPETMPLIWRYLIYENGRTCDFSYGGLLIWTPLFDYEYALYHDTLFIKGRLEGDMSKPAFSLPLGALPLNKSVECLRRWCDAHKQSLRFSAIPEYMLEEFEALHPVSVRQQPDWADYLYRIEPLATLSGKKMAKKRNHVNKFEATYPDHEFKLIRAENIADARQLLAQVAAESGDDSKMAQTERKLCADTLDLLENYNMPMIGGILYASGSPVAFTVGDIKHDTLYIHIEKALRSVPGSYEAINKYFAAFMLENCPSLAYVNREDDAGSPGLRYAKESYHPEALLHKYDIVF